MNVVKNIDTGAEYYFDARTPYEAMGKMKYYLGLSKGKSEEAKIEISEHQNFLYMVINEETYCTKNARF